MPRQTDPPDQEEILAPTALSQFQQVVVKVSPQALSQVQQDVEKVGILIQNDVRGWVRFDRQLNQGAQKI